MDRRNFVKAVTLIPAALLGQTVLGAPVKAPVVTEKRTFPANQGDQVRIWTIKGANADSIQMALTKQVLNWDGLAELTVDWSEGVNRETIYCMGITFDLVESPRYFSVVRTEGGKRVVYTVDKKR